MRRGSALRFRAPRARLRAARGTGRSACRSRGASATGACRAGGCGARRIRAPRDLSAEPDRKHHRGLQAGAGELRAAHAVLAPGRTQIGSPICQAAPTRPAPGRKVKSREASMKRCAPCIARRGPGGEVAQHVRASSGVQTIAQSQRNVSQSGLQRADSALGGARASARRSVTVWSSLSSCWMRFCLVTSRPMPR